MISRIGPGQPLSYTKTTGDDKHGTRRLRNSVRIRPKWPMASRFSARSAKGAFRRGRSEKAGILWRVPKRASNFEFPLTGNLVLNKLSPVWVTWLVTRDPGQVNRQLRRCALRPQRTRYQHDERGRIKMTSQTSANLQAGITPPNQAALVRGFFSRTRALGRTSFGAAK
jgi:hypothetical protein